MRVEPRPDADVEVVQRADGAEVTRQPSRSVRQKRSILPRAGASYGPACKQRDARGGRTPAREYVAAVGRAVVEIEARRACRAGAAARRGARACRLALAVVRLERDDVARGVVEQGVDAHGRAARRRPEAGRGTRRRATGRAARPASAGAPCRSCHRPARARVEAALGEIRRTVDSLTPPAGRGRGPAACAGSATPTGRVLACGCPEQLAQLPGQITPAALVGRAWGATQPGPPA